MPWCRRRSDRESCTTSTTSLALVSPATPIGRSTPHCPRFQTKKISWKIARYNGWEVLPPGSLIMSKGGSFLLMSIATWAAWPQWNEEKSEQKKYISNSYRPQCRWQGQPPSKPSRLCRNITKQPSSTRRLSTLSSPENSGEIRKKILIRCFFGKINSQTLVILRLPGSRNLCQCWSTTSPSLIEVYRGPWGSTMTVRYFIILSCVKLFIMTL